MSSKLAVGSSVKITHRGRGEIHSTYNSRTGSNWVAELAADRFIKEVGPAFVPGIKVMLAQSDALSFLTGVPVSGVSLLEGYDVEAS